MGRIAGIETPFVDAVLALVQQLGRVRAIYPTFPEQDVPPHLARPLRQAGAHA
jgi:2-dehydropantoate 2-reductase